MQPLTRPFYKIERLNTLESVGKWSHQSSIRQMAGHEARSTDHESTGIQGQIDRECRRVEHQSPSTAVDCVVASTGKPFLPAFGEALHMNETPASQNFRCQRQLHLLYQARSADRKNVITSKLIRGQVRPG